ncbi:ABC transporter ATP-binding protein [Pontibacillus marinus]|uniref:Multidrug ABC transporter ATP-binding protein n=1 Tax=Pontibacillus marinus BH030004 = DSM 16465 TaxID=1385511 RepID=A0A0A5GHG6_9BACI|nr:multidrug ABC transporter ATP-binding protein [Pontibacillus marinus BH030004 = DSM 16465]
MGKQTENRGRSHPHQNRGMKIQPPKIDDIKGTVFRIWKYLSREKGKFILVLSMVLISSILSLLGPYYLGVAVDRVIANPDPDTLLWMLGLLLLIYLFQFTAVFLQNFWMIGIAQNSVFTMRNDLFSHLQELNMSFYQKKQHGEIMSRVTNDIENVSKTLNSSVIQFTTSTITLIGTIGMMLWLSPLLTLLTLTIVPVMFYGMKWITKRTSVFFKEQQKNLGELNGFIEESITGHNIIKMFSQEEKMIDSFKKKNEALRNSGYWAMTYTGFIPKLMNMLNNVSFAIIVGLGGALAIGGGWGVSIGVIVTFTTYSRQFTRPLSDLANQFNMILSAVAGAERVFNILDEPEEKDAESAKDLSDLNGKVEFKDVSFSYEGDEDTLNNINFHAAPGETVALVGPTGAGKTTIISLLARFYEPESGQILVDGRNMSEITRKSLRKHVGTVLQDSFLFETTVRENIRYGRLDATDEEVEGAAKSANAHHFITNLPNGYDTVLQSDGSGISQGQRQLLSIARAMLSNPSLLILDEATSSIDTITEIKINDALGKLMEGRTSFVIAHRLNTIQNADQILVLNEGEIIERGSHAELVKQDGFYAGLVSTQSQKASSFGN